MYRVRHYFREAFLLARAELHASRPPRIGAAASTGEKACINCVLLQRIPPSTAGFQPEITTDISDDVLVRARCGE